MMTVDYSMRWALQYVKHADKSTQLGSTNKTKINTDKARSQRQEGWRMPLPCYAAAGQPKNQCLQPHLLDGWRHEDNACHWPVSESSQGLDVWVAKFILEQLKYCIKVFQEVLQTFKKNQRMVCYLALYNTYYTNCRYAIPVTRTEASVGYYELTYKT